MLDDLKTYNFKVEVSNIVKVYLDDVFILEANIGFKKGLKVACVSKSACRYSDISISMTEESYKNHLHFQQEEIDRLNLLQQDYPKLECIKKIDLKNFGSGRQIRIVRSNDKTLFVIAQHQKRMVNADNLCLIPRRYATYRLFYRASFSGDYRADYGFFINANLSSFSR